MEFEYVSIFWGIVIACFVAFIIACVLNKKYNSSGNLPFKYGYFLTVFIIIENIILIILLIIDINEKVQGWHPEYTEIFRDIVFIIISIVLLSGGAILNAKKYKIGGIFVSILTFNLICIFYYQNRWNEFKKLPKWSEVRKTLDKKRSEINKFLLPKFFLFLSNETKTRIKIASFENKSYKEILIENNMGEYISIFEKNKIDDLLMIIDLTENDYEKMGIELMGDRKRLLKIFSKDERIIQAEYMQKKPVCDTPSGTQMIITENTVKEINMYYCLNCGAQLQEGDLFCIRCGTKVKGI